MACHGVIHSAASRGDIGTLKELLTKGGDIEARNGDMMRTPLLEAVFLGKLDASRFLLDQGADIQAKDYYCRTQLHLSAINGDLPMTKMLIDKGADPFATDDCYEGVTPDVLASDGGYREVARIIGGAMPEAMKRKYGKNKNE